MAAKKTTTAKKAPAPPPSFPPEFSNIQRAVLSVFREVGPQVGKDGVNQHFKFKYVSIDKMLMHLRPAFMKYGLLMYMTETGFDLCTETKGSPTAFVKFDFWFEWGNEKTPVQTMTQVVILKKEQSTGAGRSYALKYFLRGYFMLALGEDDLDASGEVIEIVSQTPQMQPAQPPQPPQPVGPAVLQQNALFHAKNRAVNELVNLGFSTDFQQTLNWILGTTGKDGDSMNERDVRALSKFLHLVKSFEGSVTEAVRKAMFDTISTKQWLIDVGLLTEASTKPKGK